MWSIFSRDPSKDFGYEINEPVSHQHNNDSIWILHDGVKKGTNELVSIFRYELKSNDQSSMDLARNSLKRIKTLRHPSILTYLDSLETDKYILIVTEHVKPLVTFLNEMSTWSDQHKESFISWGIYSLSKGLCFLNNDCKFVHGNLSMNSVFINNSCDWKLFNFEYITNIGSNQPIKTLNSHKIYTPPEMLNNQRAVTDKLTDSWGLSCLIWEIFNGQLNEQTQLKNVKRLPKKLLPLYSKLNNNNCSQRCLIEDFLAKGQEKNGYFKNTFIDTMNFLEEIQIKDSTERNRFFSNLNNSIESFPKYLCKNKILTFIVSSFEYGEANCHCLDLLLKIGKMLTDGEYEKRITPSIIKLFASKDRSIRSKLLKELDEYIDHTSNQSVNDQIFPYLVHGFMDSNPVIREQTVKSIFHLSPKLNKHNLNEEVIKHFSRIQMKDPEGGIRTNTIICLGKIASNLQPHTRQTIMLPLFLRSLRDPFYPSRIAAIQSLSATQNFFTLQDCCSKIMPALCLILMDPEKQVRDQSFSALKNFMQKIERFSENPSLIEHMESEIYESGSDVSTKFASGLTWAVNSLAAKLARTKIENENTDNQPKQQLQPNSPTLSSSNTNAPSSNVKQDDIPKNPIEVVETSAPTNNCDGWEDDDWDNDEIFNDNNQNANDSNKSVVDREQKIIENKYNSWNDDDFDFNDDLEPFSSKPESKISTTTTKSRANQKLNTASNTTNNINNSDSNRQKKGPLKLGARKLH